MDSLPKANLFPKNEKSKGGDETFVPVLAKKKDFRYDIL
jgi:hypothetical protein